MRRIISPIASRPRVGPTSGSSWWTRSRDRTVEIARREADIVVVRDFDDFATQRNTGLEAASGDWLLSVDADERVTPELAIEIRRVINDPAAPYRGYRVPIRSEVLGRRFAFSGTQHDLPVRLFRRDCGRWVGLVHETIDLCGPVGSVSSPPRHRTIPTDEGLSREDQPLHDARSRGSGPIASSLSRDRPDAPPALDLSQALRFQARVSRRRRGVHLLPVLGGK